MKRVLFFLGQLDDMDVEWMIENGHKIELESGTILIQKGESVENLYIILSGKMSVNTGGLDSKIIAMIDTGEIIGEMSLVEAKVPSVSVIATEKCAVFAISREVINKRFAENANFKANFYYALALFLSNRLRKTTDQLGYGEPEEEDLIDTNILDNVAQAGSRFGQILHRFLEI